MGNNYSGEMFLDTLFKDLYKSKEVLNGNKNPSQKEENIKRYMERLEILHKRANEREHDIYLLKKLYFDKYVIKEEDIPESYYKHHQEKLLERGFGRVEMNIHKKREISSTIIKEQEKSLEYWIDYFISQDSNIYPMWVKYWAFQGMLKLGSYDKEKRIFSRRTKGTTAPFIELNQEALSLSIDTILKYINKEEIIDKNLEKIIETGIFGKIYSYHLFQLDKVNKEDALENDGIWIKYPKKSDHMILVNSLQGKGTGWCTSGESTAKKQLEDGDFYVYYSFDINNKPTIPRIAIRMENDKIAEIRGIAKNQNIESDMEIIVDKKLEEFKDKNEYKQKVEDMKQLTKIYNEYKNRDLNKDELKFLYEIDKNIKSFGYSKDPRIDEILLERNHRKDLSKIFNCNDSEIMIKADEFKSLFDEYYEEEKPIFDTRILKTKKIICFIGDIYIHNPKILPIILPKCLKGECVFDLTTINGLVLPEILNGYIDFRFLKEAEYLTFPKIMCGNITARFLSTVKELILPEEMNGDIYLDSLITVEKLVFPKTINGNIHLNGLVNVKEIVLPEAMNGKIHLNDFVNKEEFNLKTK